MPDRLTLFDVGFHGDDHLITVARAVLDTCQAFVETGANVGSTLAFVAREYPGVACLSCEPDREAFERARENTATLGNVKLYNEPSPMFLEWISHSPLSLRRETIFWLDAHGWGGGEPILDELWTVTRRWPQGWALCDDFRVPGMPEFEYRPWCTWETARRALCVGRAYRRWVPGYTEKTSPHHPLTGWMLLEWGHEAVPGLPASARLCDAGV